MALANLLFSLCAVSVLVVVDCWIPTYPMDYPTCETITVRLCLYMKYNLTRLPNHIGYTDQAAIHRFTEQKELQSLIKTKCSADLVFFLCATLVPICVNSGQFPTPPMVRPCRVLCENVYNDCIPSMRSLKFHWPTNLNCSGLPDHATGMCIRPSSFATTSFAKLKATCRGTRTSWKKSLRVKNLSKYDHVFRAKRISVHGDKTKIRLSVQKFFKATSKNNPRTYIMNVNRHCKHHVKTKMVLVLGNKENDVVKISEIMEWKSQYSREIRKYLRINKRQGNKG